MLAIFDLLIKISLGLKGKEVSVLFLHYTSLPFPTETKPPVYTTALSRQDSVYMWTGVIPPGPKTKFQTWSEQLSEKIIHFVSCEIGRLIR